MRQRAAALAALALTAAGCGGGSGHVSFPDFQREANGICMRYARSVNALPDPQTMSGIAVAARRSYALGRREREQLRELDVPMDARRDFDRMLARLEQADGLLPEVWQAASQGNQVRVRGLVAQAKPIVAQANTRAFALGLDDCRRR
ncbi:MAG: hypothetical protein ACXVZ4_08250 [Gaiellaceae bacterium]